MKEIRISQERFDLKALLHRTIEFLRGQVSTEVDPTYAMVSVERPGDVPVFSTESGWDVLSALKQEAKAVFFPFAYADADGTLTCADGNMYGPMSDDEDSEDGLFIGMEDSVGYLVQVKDGTVIINAAIHAGGGCPGASPRVNVSSDCGILEDPMEKFIPSFIKG